MTPRFAALFWRQIVRPWAAHPLLPLLNILGIAIGVAVFLSIQMANRGALASFQNAVGLVAGRANLEIRGDLPEEIFPLVAKTPGISSATPLVEGIATLPDTPGDYLRILGVDPFTGSSLRVFELIDPAGAPLDLEMWLREPDVIALPPQRDLPDSFRVLAAGRSVTLRHGFDLKTDDAAVASDPRIAAMDVGWAQQLLDLGGRLTSIQIRVEDPLAMDAVIATLRGIAPPDALIGPPARRGAETELMLAAFQLNLTALSLVSMVVGVYLIYNSLSATVVRRRHEIGILRANGATKLEVMALFLGEGLCCGFLGTLLGLVLAGPLAAILAAPVSQTVSSLYALVTIEQPVLTSGQVLLAFAAGLGASLIAAWRPAAEAAGCDPALVLRPGSQADSFSVYSRHWGFWGTACLLLSAGLSWGALHGGGEFLAFASVALLVAGFSLLVPAAVNLFVRLVHGPGWMVRLAAQHLGRSLHRNAVTIAALAVAVAMTVSVSVMIHSFRASVTSWLGNTLVADLFIAPAANEITGLQSFLPSASVAWVQRDPRLKELATFREMPVPWGEKSANLAIIEGSARGELDFIAGPPDARAIFHQPGMVAVSESFANRHGTKPGDVLEFSSPKGPAAFRVVGIIKDFTRDSGLVMIDRPNFRQFWSDERLHSLSISLNDPATSASFAEDFRANFGRAGELSIYTNSDLRRRVMEIFDQTFAVTSVLRAIAVVVAIAGVLLSLTTLVVEREREIGILRSQGASCAQVRWLILSEAAMIGLLAAIVGLLCGASMAMVLTWVINKAFFGWTIELRYPLGVLLSTPLWIIPAALFAAWLPARRASLIPPARALRFE
ncbi:MAG: FtsX-like permease family protein [Proteobacteria bacterium]|nr:FtsX-like permease family protein [Pseudomonadota bacterium]